MQVIDNFTDTDLDSSVVLLKGNAINSNTQAIKAQSSLIKSKAINLLQFREIKSQMESLKIKLFDEE